MLVRLGGEGTGIGDENNGFRRGCCSGEKPGRESGIARLKRRRICYLRRALS